MAKLCPLHKLKSIDGGGLPPPKEVEEMAKARLSVTGMSWFSYPGATDADIVIYAIEQALAGLDKQITDEIESIAITREVNPNE